MTQTAKNLALPQASSQRLFGAVQMIGRHPDWRALYEHLPAERLPWFYPTLDPDLATELSRRGLVGGRLLDIGTGTGQQAVALARVGFDVTATDLSPAAIAQARALTPAEPGLQFRVDDILATTLESVFDFAFDRGCMHVLPPAARPLFVAATAALVRAGGLLFLKCVSTDEGAAPFGPERLSEAELAGAFAGSFTLESCVSTVFQGPLAHQPRSLFAVLRRLAPGEL